MYGAAREPVGGPAEGPDGDGVTVKSEPPYPPVSLLRVALTGCCPRCGQGKLYQSFLKVADRCAVCGLRLNVHDTGDAPAVFVVLFLGVLVVALALTVEAVFAPPMWVHVVLWPPVILGVALGMLVVIKSFFIALHCRNWAEDDDAPR